ncbi:MAG: molybdopterin-dependent oxidoreductase [Anaerolineae bacterium]|nr:molybdopterin-dependent oxidoreductase [Anaerolineae bacterium]
MGKLKSMHTPIFWAEGHPGTLMAEGWTVEIDGLVAHPKVLTYADLRVLPKTIADARLTSVTRWSVRGEWGGVHLSAVFAEAGVLPEATHVEFTSYRKIYMTTIPLEIALRERTLLAYEFDGEPLDADYGGPVRAFVPYLWGYKSAKSIIRVTLLDRARPGFWELRGYPDEATIEAGRVHDVNTHRWRRIPGGEVIEFLDREA